MSKWKIVINNQQNAKTVEINMYEQHIEHACVCMLAIGCSLARWFMHLWINCKCHLSIITFSENGNKSNLSTVLRRGARNATVCYCLIIIMPLKCIPTYSYSQTHNRLQVWATAVIIIITYALLSVRYMKYDGRLDTEFKRFYKIVSRNDGFFCFFFFLSSVHRNE